MDWASWGLDKLDWAFVLGILNIVIIDLILAGDNAVVIAMAVRSLPRQQRQWGIILGAGAAVVLRVVLTFFVAQLLEIQFIKLTGGVLIAWIAVKLFVEGDVRAGSVHSLRGLHQQPFIHAHGPLSHYHLHRGRGLGPGGRGDDLHRPRRGALVQPAHLVLLYHGGSVCRGGDRGGQAVAQVCLA